MSLYRANPCQACRAENVTTLLDFGTQVLCNRYVTMPQETEARFPFVLGQCGTCGLVQLPQPVDPAELQARFDWIRYNEQEGHLDDLVARLAMLPGMCPAAHIGALSFKDDTTIHRFQHRGFTNPLRLDPAVDLGIHEPTAGLETLQARLSGAQAERIAARRGRCDLLVARHILEHTHATRAFAEALKELVKPGGYLVFEVPDCQPALTRNDYSMPWEEHLVYFTPATFLGTLRRLGFALVFHHTYVYAHENSLVAVVQVAGDGEDRLAPDQPEEPPLRSPAVNGGEILTGPALDQELERGRAYRAAFLPTRDKVAQALARHRRQGGKVAVFGAGHLSCFWINALQVRSYLDFVVDDHPAKRGLLMPGSRLPIRGSSALLEENITLCLSSLSPESEAKVIAKNQAFISRGGSFASMFPGRPNSL